MISVILPVEAFALGEFPSNPDPKARYIFYMHGVYPEKHGGVGDYNYWGIVKALQAKGLVVIGEVRGHTEFPTLIKLTVCWMLEYHQPISLLLGIQRAAS